MTTPSAARVLLLAHENPEAWAFMPAFFIRVRKFVEKYASGRLTMATEELVRGVRHHFAVDKPAWLGVVAVEGGKIVGHILAQIADVSDGKTILVNQAEVDAPLSKEMIEEARRLLVGWGARMWNATGIRVHARNYAVARLLRRAYGFEGASVTMDLFSGTVPEERHAG